MLSLSKNIQDHTRSFLSFKEIHTTRSVCKQWADIENVPKNLTHMGGSIPSYASFTRITRCSIYIPGPNSQALLHRVLQHNRRYLRSLSFGYRFLPEHLYFPQLDALEVFRVENPNKETLEAILPKAPNLKELCVENLDFEVDLSLCPRLEKLSCPSGNNIKNLHDANISRIDLFSRGSTKLISSLDRCRAGPQSTNFSSVWFNFLTCSVYSGSCSAQT